jgi:alpha-L-fucosidase
VRELLSDYGKIDLIFFDFSYPERFGWTSPRDGGPFLGYKGREAWNAEALAKMCRELQPQILINDRLDLDDVPEGWDYTTPEQFVPRDGVVKDGQKVVWEACHTFSGSWGYFRDEESWKSAEQLLFLLIDGVAKGGNLLMNVGPTGRGDFDPRAEEALAAYGRWMKRHSRSIYGCGAAPEKFSAPPGCTLTYNAERNRLYLHIFHWPFEQLHLDGFAGRVSYAQLLHDASEVKFSETSGASNDAAGEHASLGEESRAGTLTLRLPVKKPSVVVPVVELLLK